MDITRYENAHKANPLLEQRGRLRGWCRLCRFCLARGASRLHLLDFLKLVLHRFTALEQRFELLCEIGQLQCHAGFFLYVALKGFRDCRCSRDAAFAGNLVYRFG